MCWTKEYIHDWHTLTPSQIWEETAAVAFWLLDPHSMNYTSCKNIFWYTQGIFHSCASLNTMLIFYNYFLYLEDYRGECIWLSILLYLASNTAQAGRPGLCTDKPSRPEPQRLFWLSSPSPSVSSLPFPKRNFVPPDKISLEGPECGTYTWSFHTGNPSWFIDSCCHINLIPETTSSLVPDVYCFSCFQGSSAHTSHHCHSSYHLIFANLLSPSCVFCIMCLYLQLSEAGTFQSNLDWTLNTAAFISQN